MTAGVVFFREQPAGVLTRFRSGGFEFRYLKRYRTDPTVPSVSATLPKSTAVFSSAHLFAFFDGLLAEGAQKTRQCHLLHIDERDAFTRLLETSTYDAIGAFSVRRRKDGRV